jgi:hypothetical protein
MISEMAPRGKPSIMASRVGRPVGRVSRSLDSERNPSVVVRAALRFMQFRLFFATSILYPKKEFVNRMGVEKTNPSEPETVAVTQLSVYRQ